MKLELKHLAPYLPYGFKFISEMDKPYDEFGEVRVWTADGIIKLFGNFCLNTYENNDAYDINFSKPILLPLSKYYSEKNGYGGYIAFKDFNNEVINKRISLKVYEHLLENKFDVFGLIDAGLAEPVTEDFNPYK